MTNSAKERIGFELEGESFRTTEKAPQSRERWLSFFGKGERPGPHPYLKGLESKVSWRWVEGPWRRRERPLLRERLCEGCKKRNGLIGVELGQVLQARGEVKPSRCLRLAKALGLLESAVDSYEGGRELFWNMSGEHLLGSGRFEHCGKACKVGLLTSF